MIFTSYFARLRNIPSNCVPIAICAKIPDFYTGAFYKQLAPSYGCLMDYKKDQQEQIYINRYSKENLNKFTPEQMLKDLYELLPEDIKTIFCIEGIPWYENPHYHVVLLCYEKPDKFCHREIVKYWLRSKGYQCDELFEEGVGIIV